MSDWLIILVAGLGSYALRLSMTLTDKVRLPASVEESAPMVAPAAFAALAASSLAGSALSAGALLGAVPILAALAAAILGTLRTGRPYVAMLAGMPAYWLTAAVC